MNPYLKLVITFISIGLTVLYGYTTKNKRKRIIGVMLILLVISIVINQSIYWFIYWDGRYHGRVVDADTGKPIEGASVAGIWTFEYNLIVTWSDGFANATETVTDANGEFRLGPILAFSFWPFAAIDSMDLVVFKPGYDSHPPAIRRKMQKPESSVTTTDGKYLVGRYADCKAWRECEVKLNKAITTEEKRKSVAQCGSRLGAMGVNLSKVYNFLKVIEKENPNLKYLE